MVNWTGSSHLTNTRDDYLGADSGKKTPELIRSIRYVKRRCLTKLIVWHR